MKIREQLEKELEQIQSEIKQLKNDEEAKKVEIAGVLSSYDIGDIVKDSNGAKYQILSFKLSYFGKTEYWGSKLNKDGSLRKGDQNEIWREFEKVEK